MSRRVIPGLEPPDAALENDIRVRLDDVEEALEKAVLADSDLLAETASHPCPRAGSDSGRCSSCSPAISATRPTRG